ncbi:unnamed protein product [Onchocerca flexuosa]|uniref:ELYS-bb domain-containing protein n=1 Tax=Onchocerca flexuosa TaxID=387005 RepID=A0A183I298_9BILA|nr:unnamed protein product [Onchocerca flexuosa]
MFSFKEQMHGMDSYHPELLPFPSSQHPFSLHPVSFNNLLLSDTENTNMLFFFRARFPVAENDFQNLCAPKRERMSISMVIDIWYWDVVCYLGQSQGSSALTGDNPFTIPATKALSSSISFKYMVWEDAERSNSNSPNFSRILSYMYLFEQNKTPSIRRACIPNQVLLLRMLSFHRKKPPQIRLNNLY